MSLAILNTFELLNCVQIPTLFNKVAILKLATNTTVNKGKVGGAWERGYTGLNPPEISTAIIPEPSLRLILVHKSQDLRRLRDGIM